MRFRLWGTRGSLPSPLRSEEIETKIQKALSAAGEAGIDLNDPAAVHAFVTSLPRFLRGTAGGDTSCLEVRSAGNLIIFDCGSGMRRLGLELMKEEFGRGQGEAHIFICHTHWDHMMGWPFFVPGFIPGNRFHIYGVHPDLEARFRHQQKKPSMFPIDLDYQAAEINFCILQEGETIQIGQTRISNMRFNHPGDSYGYRVQDNDGVFIYAGDSEYKTLDPAATRPYVDFFRDADALVFDAMFSLRESLQKEDWGHSNAVAGADLATRAGVRRLLLFHHAPTYTDEEVWSLRDIAEDYLKQHPERPPCEIIVAYDGLEMELWREAKLKAHIEKLDEGVVIHLNGRLTQETAPVFSSAVEEAVLQATEPPPSIVINLQALINLGHDGLRSLFEARRCGYPLALSGPSTEILNTLSKAGARDYFAIFDTVPRALTTLRQQAHLQVGQVLNNRFKIAEPLASNALGDLYRAIDQSTQQQAIIQVLSPSLGPTYVTSLINMAEKAADLHHPLIADILHTGQDSNIKYVALEHTPGQSIRQRLDVEDEPIPVPPEQVAQIGLQIVQALEHAHSQDITHGALSPTHIILDQDTIKISHFGIGRPEIKKPLNKLPAHVGSLDYLAPEQIQGRGTGPASDLYALGVIMYEMLTGSPPFAATVNDADLISLQLRQSPVPLRRRNPAISRLLEHLVLQLLQKSPAQRPANAGVVRQMLSSLTPQPAPGTLPGQEEIRQKLRNHLTRVAQGQSGLVTVYGEKGVGKSQIVLSAAEQPIGDESVMMLSGELYAEEYTQPYKIFTRALRRTLLELPAHQLTELFNELGDLGPPLTALIPELRSALSTLPSSQVECHRLEEAICELLRLLTTKGPVTLILDGLQWSDVTCMRILSRLTRQKIPGLLILALYRDKAVGPDYPLYQALDALESYIDEKIKVEPLRPIDVYQVASTLSTSHQVPSDFGLWLYSQTQGNPLFVEQMIQAYLEGPSDTRQPHERQKVTSLEDIILRRLEQVPDSTLRALRQAAVLGHSFQIRALCSALDQPERQIISDLEHAFQARLLVGHPANDRCRFSHPIIREVVYAEMLAGVRRRYHRRAAYVLEPKGAMGVLDERLDPLAHHLVRAGELDKAIVYLARATRRARELCAYEAAINYVDQALALVEQLHQAATKERERGHRAAQRQDLLAARANLEKKTESLFFVNV